MYLIVICVLCSCVSFVALFVFVLFLFIFFFKQKTAYEMRISDWSSDVCSSDLALHGVPDPAQRAAARIPGTDAAAGRGGALIEIGRASCRERVCQYV